MYEKTSFICIENYAKSQKNRRSALGYLLIMLFVKIKVCGKTNISYMSDKSLPKKLTPHPHPRQNQLV